MQSSSGQPTYDSKIATELVIALGESPNQEEVLCCCPLCDEQDPHKKKLAVNLRKSKYYCFKCLANGGTIEMAQLLMSIGHILTKRNIARALNPPKPIKFELITVKVDSLPPLLRQQVLTDLLPRKVFTEEEILQMDYGVSGSRPKKWIGRVVIEADGLKFGKAIDKSIKPKYLTQPNFKLIEHGYINLSQVKRDGKPAVMSEGLLDLKSLPEGRGLMSPGTSGLFNDMLKTVSHEIPLIVVPDSDVAGVNAFLRILNKRMLEDPMAQLKFCFASWITHKEGDDINDLLLTGLTKQSLYDTLVSRALTGIITLNKLKESYDIVKGPKGWMIKKEPGEVKPNGTKRFTNTKDGSGGKYSKAEKRNNGGDTGLSWF